MPSLFSFYTAASVVPPSRFFPPCAEPHEALLTCGAEKPEGPPSAKKTPPSIFSTSSSEGFSPVFRQCILSEKDTEFAIVRRISRRMRFKSLRKKKLSQKRSSSVMSRETPDSVFTSTGVSSYCSSDSDTSDHYPIEARLSSRTRLRILAMLSLKRSRQLSKTLVCVLHASAWEGSL